MMPYNPDFAYPCAICGKMTMGEPPHGDDPCPEKLKVDEAYIAKLDAERMYYLRGGQNIADMMADVTRIAATFPEPDAGA